MKKPASESAWLSTSFWTLFIILSLLGFVLRVAAVGHDFSLDEIWSLSFATKADGLGDLFLHFKHDNNHLLNTAFMYLLGEQGHWMHYRWLALLGGAATVPLMGAIALTGGRLAALTAVALSMICYPFVLYSTEARGYGPLLFFSAASVYLWVSGRRDRGPYWAAVFNLCIVLGFLSHLTFLFCYLGLLVVDLSRAAEVLPDGKRAFRQMLKFHAIPLMTGALLYFLFVRGMQYGGGTPFPFLEAGAHMLAFTLGAPTTPTIAVTVAVAMLCVIGWAIYSLSRKNDREGAFFVVVVFLAPILLLYKTDETDIHPRYFLVPAQFALLLVSLFLAQLARRNFLGYTTFAVLAGAILLGNGYRVLPFLQHGHGHYLEALLFLADKTQGYGLTLGGSDYFGQRMMLAYYDRFLPVGRRIHYVPFADSSGEEPEWAVLYTAESDPRLKSGRFISRSGTAYVLEKGFRYSCAKGGHWRLFRKATGDSGNIRGQAAGCPVPPSKR